MRAWENGDVDAVVAMLTEDVTLTMPPRPTWFRGRDAVAGFLREYPLAGEQTSRLVPAGFSGQIAFTYFFGDVPHGITVLTLRGEQIADITTFLDAQ